LSRQVVGEGMRLAIAGAVTGLILAVAVARVLRHLLHGVGAFDPPTLIAVPTILLVVAFTACWLPGRRAMRVAPSQALRGDG
jgi:putative ABC transport system permease protein